MPISNKTRKFLWSKSGNRCAICKTELFTNKADKDDLNIGEECHIISFKKNEPRHFICNILLFITKNKHAFYW